MPHTYESPTFRGPFQVYETPMLLDIEDAASCDWGCLTSGDAAPTPIKRVDAGDGSGEIVV